ncbi:hypothetical protein [Neoaquamicrobium sediminum]|uniref:hypothetical protein n=1 Tax=Neoaquamicrobium sediminum TaxID=1849104 RepID=UPI0015664CCE|nr:hypothetical protein [Mesorhizobium sediminum]NRC56555.1 hypothetical protein [Mesorhizobium sediminum]
MEPIVVTRRIGIDDDQPGHQSLRLGDGHAYPDAMRLGVCIERGDGIVLQTFWQEPWGMRASPFVERVSCSKAVTSIAL